MIFYLTFNDAPSGIYSGQVIDVVKFLREELKADVRLVSFISLRSFFRNRAKIKSELKDAIVIPMFPGLGNWKKNKLLLGFLLGIYKPEKIMARSVLACSLALHFKSGKIKVLYDGRGAITAEWREYGVVKDPLLLKTIHDLEKECVLKSDFRIAVSNKLLDYWKTEFGYNGRSHVVIPCTLNKVFENSEISADKIFRSRKKLGYDSNHVLIIYSGSIAGWQSFNLLASFVKPILLQSKSNKILFLSDLCEEFSALRKEYPEQVQVLKLKSNEVPDYLISGDYGLLIRESSITNKVASPVKFAEYLSCGLKVIISPEIGDFSDLVVREEIGAASFSSYNFQKVEIAEKLRIRSFALEHFSKIAFFEQYKKLVNSDY